MPSEPHPGRVIIPYGRSLMALVAAQSLARRGVEVIGCDSIGLTMLSFSRKVAKHDIYTEPKRDPDRFIEDMLRIVDTHRPQDDRPYVLLPMFNETKILAAAAERFEGRISLAAPPMQAIGQVDPKHHFAETATDLDIAIPRSFVLRSEADLTQAADALGFPCLIKPSDEVGGRGIQKLRDRAALDRAYRGLSERYDEPPILQALAEGEDFCYCALVENGTVKADMVYRNLDTFPEEFGAGVIRETVDPAPFRERAAPLLRSVGWHGAAEIDFMADPEDLSDPLMIELNPRFWANLDHSISSGIDFPWLAYRLAVDGRVPDCEPAEIGYRSKLPGIWLLSALDEVLEDEDSAEARSEANFRILDALSGGDVRAALSAFRDAQHKGLGLRDAFRRLRDGIRQAKSAETLDFDEDDPFVGLGILYVLGWLIKHRELPPELRR